MGRCLCPTTNSSATSARSCLRRSSVSSITKRERSSARIVAAKTSSSAGPPSPSSRRKKARSARACHDQLTTKENRRRLLPFHKYDRSRYWRDFLSRPKPKGVHSMYTRVVELTSKSGKARELASTINDRVLPILKKQAGFVDEAVLASDTEATRMLVLSFWNSKADAER